MEIFYWEEYEREVRAVLGAQGTHAVFYRDGIVNQHEWENGNRILFVLKEVHDEEEHEPIKKNELNWQNLLCEDGDVIRKGETTWRKISTLAAGFEKAIKTNKAVSKDDYHLHIRPEHDKNNHHIIAISKTAIINLKKIGAGKNTSEQKSIQTIHYSEHCKKFKEYLLKQIKSIDPQIIVCCSPEVFTLFNNHLYPQYKHQTKSYITEDNRIVIKGFHPTAPKSYDEYYVEPINACLKLMQQKNHKSHP